MAGWKRGISICRVVCLIEVGFFIAPFPEKIIVGRGSNGQGVGFVDEFVEMHFYQKYVFKR